MCWFYANLYSKVDSLPDHFQCLCHNSLFQVFFRRTDASWKVALQKVQRLRSGGRNNNTLVVSPRSYTRMVSVGTRIIRWSGQGPITQNKINRQYSQHVQHLPAKNKTIFVFVMFVMSL